MLVDYELCGKVALATHNHNQSLENKVSEVMCEFKNEIDVKNIVRPGNRLRERLV